MHVIYDLSRIRNGSGMLVVDVTLQEDVEECSQL